MRMIRDACPAMAGVVRDKDQGHAQLLMQLQRAVRCISCGIFAVEIAGGFVGKQHRGPVGQTAGNGDTLPLPAGKL